MAKLEFVSYDGTYPTLCMGTLVIRVDGKKYTLKSCNMIWNSGGCVTFDKDYNEIVTSGPWIVNGDRLPKKLQPYAKDIEELMNSNIPHGCCGGCV